jgi:hypothetical protein
MYIYDNNSFKSFTMKNILEKPTEEITTHNSAFQNSWRL